MAIKEVFMYKQTAEDRLKRFYKFGQYSIVEKELDETYLMF
jgi:hypothetical protein